MTGFQAPNYTQVPNDYFDLVMEMTEAETKILTALIRITFGYHRDEIEMSVRELAKVTKMSTSSVWIGAEKLEGRGLVERSVSKNTTATKWTVLISDTKLYRQIVKTVSNDSDKKPVLPLKKERKKEIKEAPAAKHETPAEVKIFREVTERYPNRINFSDVTMIIQGVSKRLGRTATAEDLRPFYAAWCAKGFKPVNLAWLSWAESGVIPQVASKVQINEPKGFDAIRQWASKQEDLVNGI